jgi:hypothetical protein
MENSLSRQNAELQLRVRVEFVIAASKRHAIVMNDPCKRGRRPEQAHAMDDRLLDLPPISFRNDAETAPPAFWHLPA